MLDAKVIPSETVAPQHNSMVETARLERFGGKKLCSTETKIRSGKLKGLVAERFRRKFLYDSRDQRVLDQQWLSGRGLRTRW